MFQTILILLFTFSKLYLPFPTLMLKRQFEVSVGKDVGSDKILNFIIKSSSEIIAVLNCIFNLSLLKGKFPSL
jgi:hypothetical protein